MGLVRYGVVCYGLVCYSRRVIARAAVRAVKVSSCLDPRCRAFPTHVDLGFVREPLPPQKDSDVS